MNSLDTVIDGIKSRNKAAKAYAAAMKQGQTAI